MERKEPLISGKSLPIADQPSEDSTIQMVSSSQLREKRVE
jgi:hypothetical protein